MITKEQALTAHEFHYVHHPDYIVGPRGGITSPKIEIWRRNGQTKTWKRQPERFRIPVKYGLYAYSYITEYDAEKFHTAEDCPLNNKPTMKHAEETVE